MVQYRGSFPMMADLVTSRIDLAMISFIVAQPFLQDSKIKIFCSGRSNKMERHAGSAHHA